MSSVKKRDKKQIAKKRWKLLINALVRKKPVNSAEGQVSVRRFSSFGLIQMTGIDVDTDGNKHHRWYECSSRQFPDFRADIRLLDGTIDIHDLLGFNNTGNVCVWPAEEVLMYHCLKNANYFKGKNVCELGGGMTCLAGLSVAVHTEAERVLLTDGNEKSVENIKGILERNEKRIGETRTEARILLWNEYEEWQELKNTFDMVICADCLFFDGCREDLSLAIHTLLKTEGEATLFAPTRGTTLEQFVTVAERLFKVTQLEIYDDTIWKSHKENVEKGEDVYDPNLHYPLMLTLKKRHPP